jgi:hypothetical protein
MTGLWGLFMVAIEAGHKQATSIQSGPTSVDYILLAAVLVVAVGIVTLGMHIK